MYNYQTIEKTIQVEVENQFGNSRTLKVTYEADSSEYPCIGIQLAGREVMWLFERFQTEIYEAIIENETQDTRYEDFENDYPNIN